MVFNGKNKLIPILLLVFLFHGSLCHAESWHSKISAVMADANYKWKEVAAWCQDRFQKLKVTLHNLRPSVQQEQMKEMADKSKKMMRREMEKFDDNLIQSKRLQQDNKIQLEDMQRQQRMMMQNLPRR